MNMGALYSNPPKQLFCNGLPGRTNAAAILYGRCMQCEATMDYRAYSMVSQWGWNDEHLASYGATLLHTLEGY